MKLLIKAGATSRRIPIFVRDTRETDGRGLAGLAWNTASLVWRYWREDEADADMTDVTLATATRGTWATGGFKEKEAAEAGWYEIGVPNAALATGANWVVMALRGAANMEIVTIEIQLDVLNAADLNAEVVDALNTDTYAEPGQEAPGASVPITTKIGYLYKAWRNRSTQINSQYDLYNDDATTVDHKASFSDDGVTADTGEVESGP